MILEARDLHSEEDARFMVSWHRYPEEDNTWEPRSSFTLDPFSSYAWAPSAGREAAARIWANRTRKGKRGGGKRASSQGRKGNS